MEIRSTRLMVSELLEVTLSGDLEPLVRKRLAEVVQLVQSYCRLAELEIASGEEPKVGDGALPNGIPDRVKGWAEREEGKRREGKELAEDLSQAIRAYGRVPSRSGRR